jgi:hypothetical protein
LGLLLGLGQSQAFRKGWPEIQKRLQRWRTPVHGLDKFGKDFPQKGGAFTRRQRGTANPLAKNQQSCQRLFQMGFRVGFQAVAEKRRS